MSKEIKPVHHEPMRGWNVVAAFAVVAAAAAIAVVVLQFLGVI